MSRVCVVGLGKLGAALAAVLADRGHKVIGLDVNQEAIDKINAGVSPVMETGLHALVTKVSKNLRATASAAEAAKYSTIAFILVPTPSDKEGLFDNRYVLEAVTALGAELKGRTDFYTVVVCSTVMPGSCDGPIKAALEAASGRHVGTDLGLCYSPEFIALGSVIRDMTHPDMVLLGADDQTSRLFLHAVLRTIPKNLPLYLNLSLVDAEIAKIAVNTYITMKISYANTLGEMCQRMPGANAGLVADAVGADSRIGRKYLTPGTAYGGPCFPRDTEAFIALADSVGVGAELAMATDIVNSRQVIQLADSLIGNVSAVSVLGLAYKPDTAVIERSFGRELVELLQFEGIAVNTYDPDFSGSINGNPLYMTAQDCVDAADVVVIATPCREFATVDFQGKTVIDMWGIVPDSECANYRRFGTFS